MAPHHLAKMRGKYQQQYHGSVLATITITKATRQSNNSLKRTATDLSHPDPVGMERKTEGAVFEITLVVLHEQLEGGILHGGVIRRNNLVV